MNFERAILALCDAGVDFVIIGGWSAILHGSARLTNDIDICFSRERENIRRLTMALAPFNPRPRDSPRELPFVWDAAMLAGATVLTLQTDLGPIDLLAEVSGLGSFDHVRARSQEVDAFGCVVLTLNLPALIAAKRAAGRAKDLLVLPELESILGATEE